MQNIEKKESIRLVKKAPIVYRYLPEELQMDRDVAIAFIKSNAEYVNAYYNALLEEKRTSSKTHEYKASSVIRTDNADLFLNGLPLDYPKILDSFTKDAEVMALLGGTRMYEVVDFTDENYDERVVSKAIGKGYNLVDPLFEYWYERLPRDKKTDDCIRTKFELTTDDSLFIVTAFKCLEVIDSGAGSHDDAYAALFMKCNTFRFEAFYDKDDDSVSAGYVSFFVDYRKEAARIFRVFPVERQNGLAGSYHFLAGLMKPDDLDPELAKIIAENCPIARQILPDEYILRYDLHRDPAHRDCTKCAKCFIRHMLLF